MMSKLDLVKAKPAIGIPYVWRGELLSTEKPHNVFSRWLVIESNQAATGVLFCKFVQFIHPQSKRMSLAQVIIAKDRRGQLREGVFTGKSYIHNWYRVVDGQPCMIVSDSNFLPVLIRSGKKKRAWNAMDCTRSELLNEMFQNALISSEEYDALMGLSLEDVSQMKALQVI